MNIDIDSGFAFGDEAGLQNFMLAHRFVHQQTADKLASQFGVAANSFGLSSSAAEDEWLAMMQSEEKVATPEALRDWLKYHADMHTQAYTLLSQSTNTAPDLSEVDFSSPEQFYDWMFSHQQMHDFEQAALGLI